MNRFNLRYPAVVVVGWVGLILGVIGLGIAIDSGSRVSEEHPTSRLLANGTVIGVDELRFPNARRSPAAREAIYILRAYPPRTPNNLIAGTTCEVPVDSGTFTVTGTACWISTPPRVVRLLRPTAGGRFKVALSPGRYVFDNEDGCGAAIVDVKAGSVSHIVLICDRPARAPFPPSPQDAGAGQASTGTG